MQYKSSVEGKLRPVIFRMIDDSKKGAEKVATLLAIQDLRLHAKLVLISSFMMRLHTM